MQIQTKQNNSRSRDLERAGAKTRHVGQNRSPRRLHFETRPTVLCLLETGGRENPCRVSGENGATKRRQASEEHELVSYGAPARPPMRNLTLGRLNVLLHLVNHGHGTNQHDGRNDLVQVKTGMKETPGDTNGSERLHHLEIARRRGAREAQTLEINQERKSA